MKYGLELETRGTCAEFRADPGGMVCAEFCSDALKLEQNLVCSQSFLNPLVSGRIFGRLFLGYSCLQRQ